MDFTTRLNYWYLLRWFPTLAQYLDCDLFVEHGLKIITSGNPL